MGLLIGSLFWDLERSLQGALPFFGVSFLSILFITMGSLPILAITLENKPVFFKHQDNFFYSSMAYVWSMVITQIPFSFVESLLFSLITYFMVGFSTGGSVQTRGHLESELRVAIELWNEMTFSYVKRASYAGTADKCGS